MSLTHEATIKRVGFQLGDMKVVNYNISFTAHQLVEPELGWFLLNGAVISQTSYPVLFAKYGSLFNTGGEGAGNFRLPDFTDGVVPVGKGLTNFTSYGDSGGEINHTLSTAELAVHSHGNTFTATASSHGHTGSATINSATSAHHHTGNSVTITSPGYGSGGGISDTFDQGLQSPASGAATHTHTASPSINNATSPNLTVGGSISATGSGGSHNNMGPYQVLGGWLVKHD